MKKYLLLLLIVISFSCTKKGNGYEYINYSSEIFTGRDTLIYGSWRYASAGIIFHKNYSGTNIQNEFNRKLNIIPIGNFEDVVNDSLRYKGKIDTVLYKDKSLGIRFCKDGIKSGLALFMKISFRGPDTLFLTPNCSDCGDGSYYIRIK